MKKILFFALLAFITFCTSGCMFSLSSDDRSDSSSSSVVSLPQSAVESNTSAVSLPQNSSEESVTDDDPKKVEFDGFEIVLNGYSFTEVKNEFSEHNKMPVVKIEATVTNKSREANTLNMFYYKLFTSSGVESPSLWAYFEDDISQAGSVLPGKSYTKYFHILYDGDGIYTIIFDKGFGDSITKEIEIKK